MTQEEMLRNIEYLREKANVTYQEASELLERFDGNVMRALVELEHQGRVYAQAPLGDEASGQREDSKRDAREKASSFIDKAFQTRLLVEKKRPDGERETVANLNVPYVAAAAIVAPWLAVGSAVVAFATGHDIKIRREEKGTPTP